MTCLRRTIQDDWDDLLEGKMSGIQLATTIWNKYTGKPEELPIIGGSVLIYRLTRVVAPGYYKVLLDGAKKWVIYDSDGGYSIDILPGDRWAYFPDPPKGEE